MSLLASDFGGRYGIWFGCCMWTIFPFFELVWIWIQLRSIFASQRLSWLSLGYLVAFFFVPGYLVLTTIGDFYAANAISRGFILVSGCSLLLFPVTVTMEVRKRFRDRPARLAARNRRDKADRSDGKTRS